MEAECLPMSVLPHMTRLFLDFCAADSRLADLYPEIADPSGWMRNGPSREPASRESLADLLRSENAALQCGPATLANIERLRSGASAVVTGQQVGLLGGPLYTLMKAATAIARAAQATAAGHDCVPVFWMATEDHDFAEVSGVALQGREAVEFFRLDAAHTPGTPVGEIRLGPVMPALLERAAPLLGDGAFSERWGTWYAPENTFAQAFGRMLADIFAPWGLIVVDASTRGFHALGREVLERTLTETDQLRGALLERDRVLAARGYNAQVLVDEQSTQLFLLQEQTRVRQPLRRSDGQWKVGGKTIASEQLLAILDETPERLSPGALLRPVFQDAIFPTSAYVGGPAEVAYFAQSEVLFRELLGRVTPVLPRLSATLIEPAIAKIMGRHQLSLTDAFLPAEELAQRLGARSLPIEGKRKLAQAGEALHTELTDVVGWMRDLDEALGRAAEISASKMRYQMNRLRRLAARHQLERTEVLRRQADSFRAHVYPDGHVQERVIGGAYFLGRYADALIPRLIDEAATSCPGHKVIPL